MFFKKDSNVTFKTPLSECKCPRVERDDFDYKEWDKISISDPEELRKKLDDMHLVGRVIKDIRLISHVYNMEEEEIESTLSRITKWYPDDFRQMMSVIDNVDDMFPFPLDMEMDEPVLIKFEDGDQFEILVISNGNYNVSMNKIPWNARGIVNDENVNGTILLDVFRGITINSVEVITEKDESGSEDITALKLSWKKEGDEFSLLFETLWFDYMRVAVVDKWNKAIRCPFITLKKSLYRD